MSKISLSVMAKLLALDSNIFVTTTSLGLLVSLYHLSTEACTDFNFPQLLSNETHT